MEPKDGDTKKMVIIKGKGTANETRIHTNITQIYHKASASWMTVPEKK